MNYTVNEDHAVVYIHEGYYSLDEFGEILARFGRDYKYGFGQMVDMLSPEVPEDEEEKHPQGLETGLGFQQIGPQDELEEEEL